MALLLPALKKAKDMARWTLCTNNLKQQGLAFNYFADDHKGAVPGAFIYSTPDGIGRYIFKPWADLFDGYPKNGYGGWTEGAIWHCPCPFLMCPSVVNPAGDGVQVAVNSQYQHYAIGQDTTYFSKFISPPIADMHDFPDLAPFVCANFIGEARYTRMFFRSLPVIYPGQAEIGPSNFNLAGDSFYYWKLDGDKAGIYRHFNRVNLLKLDLSVRPAHRIATYGWKVLRE